MSLRRIATLATAVLGLAAGTALAQLQPGKDYTLLKPPQASEAGKIEVIEFFSYGCPHCADLEPEMQKWMKTLPADVTLVRVPVMFQERWITLAKIFYTLEGLGVEQRLSPEVFTAMHKGGVNFSSEKVFFDWAASKGLDRKKVEDMYASFAIAGKINRAKAEAKQYNVQSVPLVIVDGRFVTAPDKVGSHAGVPAAIDALLVKARAERPKS